MMCMCHVTRLALDCLSVYSEKEAGAYPAGEAKVREHDAQAETQGGRPRGKAKTQEGYEEGQGQNPHCAILNSAQTSVHYTYVK